MGLCFRRPDGLRAWRSRLGQNLLNGRRGYANMQSSGEPPVLQSQPASLGSQASMVPMPMAHAQPVGGGGGLFNQQGMAPRPTYMPAGIMPAGGPSNTQNAYHGGAKRAQAQKEGLLKPVLNSPVLCDAADSRNFPLGTCRVQVDVHMASMFVNMVCSWRVEAHASTTGLFKRALPLVSASQPHALCQFLSLHAVLHSPDIA
eukprot:COSAG02_NODE_3197_length_7187_cov_2.437923_1_plen_202_part_00